MTEDECVAAIIGSGRYIGCPEEAVRDAYRAGAATSKPTLPPGPPPGFVRVRVPITVSPNGGWAARGHKYFIEADLPIPQPPETIVAQVVEAGE